jgi:hypothetical protein
VKRTKSGKSTGSRNSDGNVPNVNWNDGKLKVNYYNPDNANGNLRSRQKFQKRNPRHLGVFFNKKMTSRNYFKYFIQPLVILEISCNSDSRFM